MLYLLYGNDTKGGREKLHALSAELQRKKPDAAYLHLTAETFDPSRLPELLYGQGLFASRCLVVLDTLSEEETSFAILQKSAPEMEASENVFIIFEGVLPKKNIAQLIKHAKKAQEFLRDAKGERTDVFNRFAITEAFAKRDRMRAWILYEEARTHGIAPEEVHGLLFWQVKCLLLAAGSASALEAGLKPFVYTKAKCTLTHFSQAELVSYSRALVTLYHDARRGKHDLDVALERFVLSI